MLKRAKKTRRPSVVGALLEILRELKAITAELRKLTACVRSGRNGHYLDMAHHNF